MRKGALELEEGGAGANLKRGSVALEAEGAQFSRADPGISFESELGVATQRAGPFDGRVGDR